MSHEDSDAALFPKELSLHGKVLKRNVSCHINFMFYMISLDFQVTTYSQT